MENTIRTRADFTASHHAILFALLARAVIESCGKEPGTAVIRDAVKTYGRQRGHRMALRARANGHDLSMANYLAYGEWTPAKNESRFRLVEKAPHARVVVNPCIWYRTWKENDLLDYGRIYCQEVDAALIEGFNPELELEIRGTLAAGHPRCDFIFKDANLTILSALRTAYRKRVKPGKACRMPWDYHCAHLYKTVGAVVVEAFGGNGRRAIASALAAFAAHYDEKMARKVASFQDVNFDTLPAS
jgi:hypothetical protein